MFLTHNIAKTIHLYHNYKEMKKYIMNGGWDHDKCLEVSYIADKELRDGLYRFSVYLKYNPPGENAGALSSARWDDPWGEPLPWFVKTTTSVLAYITIGLLLFIGIICLGCSIQNLRYFKKKDLVAPTELKYF
jgi:hypothetical protein